MPVGVSSKAAAFGGDEKTVDAPGPNPNVVASLSAGRVGGGVRTAETVLSLSRSPAQFEHWPDDEMVLPQSGQTILIQAIAESHHNMASIKRPR